MSEVSKWRDKFDQEYIEYRKETWEEEQRKNEDLIIKAREREREE